MIACVSSILINSSGLIATWIISNSGIDTYEATTAWGLSVVTLKTEQFAHNNLTDWIMRLFKRQKIQWPLQKETIPQNGMAPSNSERLRVNYARHRLTNYHQLLERFDGGDFAVLSALHLRVYSAIAVVYPQLPRSA